MRYGKRPDIEEILGYFGVKREERTVIGVVGADALDIVEQGLRGSGPGRSAVSSGPRNARGGRPDQRRRWATTSGRSKLADHVDER
jgi:hypothetical protein